MELELNPGDKIQSPTEEQIEVAIRALPAADDAFAILGAEDQRYIQTSGHPAIGFTLEYRDGSQERHFHCTLDTVSTDQVVAAFRSYLREDGQFKSELPWAPGDYAPSHSPPYRLFLLGLVVLCGLLLWFFLS